MSKARIAWDFDTVPWPVGQAGRASLRREGAHRAEVRYTQIGGLARARMPVVRRRDG